MIKVNSKYSILPLVVTLFLVHTACNNKPSSPVIARVGRSVLTVDDLHENIPPEYSEQITREQNIDYVKQWMDTELLYREALRKKFDKEPQIKERLEKMKKDLLAAEVINRYSLQHESSTIDQIMVHDYYDQHKLSFVREKEMIKYLEIVTDDHASASYISRNATLQNFSSLASRYSKIPYADSASIPYVAFDEIQPEIRQVIASTPVLKTTNPVKTELGYHIIMVIDKLEKGGICKEEEVWEEILTLLSTKTHKERMERLLADLRLKTDVEFNFSLISGVDSDSAKQ